jgi:hypothetical protein
MFRPDEAIFRYIGGLQSPVSLSATLPTLDSVYTLGVRCVYGFYCPSYKKQHSKTQEQATEIHTDSTHAPTHQKKKNTYRHQLRLTG